MTPATARAMHRRQIEAHGEEITLRRPPSTDITVRARVTGYQPEELAGGIQHGDRRIIVMAEDVTFDPALKRGDVALVRGSALMIEEVDNSTRRIDGELIAYDIRAKGSPR